MSLDEIKSRLTSANTPHIARELDYTPTYLYMIKTGRRTNPSYTLMQKLSDYFEKEDANGKDA